MTTTSRGGVYAIRFLPPGLYAISIEAPGFKTGVRRVEVIVQRTVVGDVRLEVGVAGRSGRTTRIQVDGIVITDEVVGTTTQNISQDALQEFELSRATFDPSTSLTSSGAVNVLTRSGTDEPHGSGREWRVASVLLFITEAAPFHEGVSPFSL